MKVALRKKKNVSGSYSLLLDYFFQGQRVRDPLGIVIHKNDEEKKTKLNLAEKIRATRELDLLHGRHGFINERRADFAAYFQNFIDQYKGNDKARFTSVLATLKDFSDKILITEKFCRDYWSYLKGEYRGATAKDYFLTFRRVVKFAVKDGVLKENFAAVVRASNPQESQLSKEVLYFDELITLYKTPCDNEEVKRAFLFACYTSLRYGDYKNLHWKHIDLKAKTFKKKQNKTQKLVDAPLNETALFLLGNPGTGLVFNLPSYWLARKTIFKWVKDAKITKHITTHCARHSFPTNLIVENVNLKIVSSLMGHSTIRQTEKYAHVADKLKRSAVESLPSLLTKVKMK